MLGVLGKASSVNAVERVDLKIVDDEGGLRAKTMHSDDEEDDDIRVASRTAHLELKLVYHHGQLTAGVIADPRHHEEALPPPPGERRAARCGRYRDVAVDIYCFRARTAGLAGSLHHCIWVRDGEQWRGARRLASRMALRAGCSQGQELRDGYD